MEKIKDFASRVGITMTCREIPKNPFRNDDRPPSQSHWECTLHRNGREYTLYLSLGSFHRAWNEPRKNDPNNPGKFLPGGYPWGCYADYAIRSKYPPVKAYGEKESVDLHDARKRFTHATPPTIEMALDSWRMEFCSLESTQSFDDWCETLGFSNDSIKAKASYDHVKESAFRFRQFLGNVEYQNFLENVEGE